MNEENWSVIPDWPEYEVSTLGRLRSSIMPGRGRKKHRILSLSARDDKGYVIARLYRGLKRTTKKVHRLVASAFMGSDSDINHKDGNKSNNRIDNLELCSEKENSRHYRREINPIFAFYGQPMSISEARDTYGSPVSYHRVYDRITRLKWTPEDSLETPALDTGRPLCR